MTTLLPRQRSNAPYRTQGQSQRSSYFPLRSIQTLIVLTIGLAAAPSSRGEIVTDTSSPVVDVIPLAPPGVSGLVGIAASPNGKEVYVADNADSTIAVINATTHLVSSFIPTMARPFGVAVSPDGGTLYVTDANDGLEVFSLPTGELVSSLPLSSVGQLLGVSPDGSILYVPLAGGTILALDYLGNVGTITTGGAPSQVVFNRSGTEAYVSDFANNDVFVINTATNAVSTITTSAATIGLAIDGTKLFATGKSGSVYLIDTATKQVTATINVPNPTGAELGLPALTEGGSFLYVPVVQFGGMSGNGQSLVVINTKTKKIEGQPIQVGLTPFQIVTAAGGKFGFVTTATTGAVDVIKLLK
jgi:YVTN family beta-propeller protein